MWYVQIQPLSFNTEFQDTTVSGHNAVRTSENRMKAITLITGLFYNSSINSTAASSTRRLTSIIIINILLYVDLQPFVDNYVLHRN
jgi:hypothetical protein